MKRIAFLFLALALLPFGTEKAAAQDYQVVVNAANGASSISKDELSKIFLKKSTKWAGGAAAVAVDLKADDATREAFSQAVHGRGASAIASYWQQQIFAGKDVPPEEKGSAAEVIAFVAGNPGAVGYVPAGTDLVHGFADRPDGWNVPLRRRVVERSAAEQPHRELLQCVAVSSDESAGVLVPGDEVVESASDDYCFVGCNVLHVPRRKNVDIVPQLHQIRAEQLGEAFSAAHLRSVGHQDAHSTSPHRLN